MPSNSVADSLQKLAAAAAGALAAVEMETGSSVPPVFYPYEPPWFNQGNGSSAPSVGEVLESALAADILALPTSALSTILSALNGIPVAYPTPGYTGVDPVGVSPPGTINKTTSQALSSNRVSIFQYENNPNLGTQNLFLSQAAVTAANLAAAAAGLPQLATLDNGIIFSIMVARSRVYPHVMPLGRYRMDLALQYQGNEDIYCEPGTIIDSHWNVPGSAITQWTTAQTNPNGRINGLKLTNVWLNKPHSHYTNWFTGLMALVVGATPLAPVFDLQDDFTVGSGNWVDTNRNPLTNYTPNGWVTSSINLFATASNTVPFDSLPPGVTLAQLNASAQPWTANTTFAAGGSCVSSGNLYTTTLGGKSGKTVGPSGTGTQARDGTITDWSLVGPGATVWVGGFNRYGRPQSVVTGAVASTATINGQAWSGYLVSFACLQSARPAFTQRPSPGALAAVPDVPASSAGPAQFGRPAIPAPGLYLLSGQPIFYQGGMFLAFCDNLEMRGCRFTGASNGRLLTISGDNPVIEDPYLGLTDGNPGTGGIRFIGGINVSVRGARGATGDDFLQFVPFQGFNAITGFGPHSNETCVFEFDNIHGTSLTGRGFIASLGYQLTIFGETRVRLGNLSTIAPTNTLTFPPGLLQNAGLTTTQLTNSFPEWAGDTYYSVGAIRNVGGNNYVAATPGTSDATGGTGPSGTGTGISDGTSGLTWNFYSVGQPVYVSASASTFYAGTYVSSAETNTDNSVTLTFAAANQPVAMAHALPVNALFTFSLGTPLGVNTNSAFGTISNSRLRSVAATTVLLANPTSTGIVDVRMSQVTIDETWSLGNGGSPQGSVQLIGSVLNQQTGVKLSMSQVHLIRPYQISLQASGWCPSVDLTHCTFEPSQNPLGPAAIVLEGVQQGSITHNTLWPGAGQNQLQLGGADVTNALSQTQDNSSSNINVLWNYFMGCQDANYAIARPNVSGDRVIGNTFVQASPLGSGSAMGIYTAVGSSNGYMVLNNWSQMDGNPYVTANGGTAPSIGLDGDSFNSAPAQTFNLPAISLPASITSLIAADITPTQVRFSALAQGPVILAAFTTLSCIVDCSQNATVASASIALPTGLPGQTIYLKTQGALTSLTFTGAASDWVNGTGLAAHAGIILQWGVFESAWLLSSQT